MIESQGSVPTRVPLYAAVHHELDYMGQRINVKDFMLHCSKIFSWGYISQTINKLMALLR